MLWVLAVSFGLLFPSRVQASVLNVTDFGARGDAVQTLAMTVSNSTQISVETTNQFSTADVGKLVELFGVGAVTSGTNRQDLIAYIQSVANGTNLTISAPASQTATQVSCTIGTQNATAFQNCVNACQGSNAVIMIPAGCYLLVPPQVLESNFVMSSATTLCLAVSISKGGITFQGDTPGDTVLLGNGAWVLNNGSALRGVLFGCVGPVTNNVAAPLVFENLTFNGGVQIGNENLGSGPASPVDGTGWDNTHDAVVDMGNPPFHANQQFLNCWFAHWRGEILKSVVSLNNGFIGVTNCAFWDGDASAFNFNWTPHVINSCLFSNLNMAMEYYVGTMQTNSYFENCVITNTRIAIVLVGALSNYPPPFYSIISNTISASKYDICLGPSRNVQITGNTFQGGGIGVATDGYAYQGTDFNGNITVENNQFNDTAYPVGICGAGVDRMVNMTVKSNTAWGCSSFATGYGWSSNVWFSQNSSLLPSPNQSGCLDSSSLVGQWFIDDGSNDFLPRSDNTYPGGLTNTVSYAYGVHHQLGVGDSQSVYLLDTSLPQSIPPGAELMITNASVYPVTLYYTSSTPFGNGLAMVAGASIACEWTNNAWQLVQSPLISPPSGLRISSP